MSSHSQHDDQANNTTDLNVTKERLLTDDIATLRDQPAKNEGFPVDEHVTIQPDAIPTLDAISLLQADNIPVLGDAVLDMAHHSIDQNDAQRSQLVTTADEIDELLTEERLSESRLPEDSTTEDHIQENTQGNATINPASTSITPDSLLASQESIPDVTVEALSENIQVEEKTLSENHTQGSQETLEVPKAKPFKAKALSSNEENPFLPQHLRDRLDKSKNSLIKEIALSDESLEASRALLRNFTYDKATTQTTPLSRKTELGESKISISHPLAKQSNHQELIDGLVEKYLPMIESDLRQHLTLLLEENDA